MSDEHDQKETYCRRLGDCIRFSYCRAAGSRHPCSGIVECWLGKLPVLEYLNEHFNRQQLEQVFAPQPDRLERILQIAQKIQQAGGQDQSRRP